ncbi:MAG: tRNA (N(6)-L-threonylcarbamoyladenosine(37)-C(2))-methylthiotransferase MtaB [Acutalibacter sp.]|jgi:threonylcarbamoyladenosine tRNA methylthiotransferase MtaB
MKAKIITLGCKVNQYESEAMLEALLSGGFQEAGPGEEADVVVINSCTVTATSDQKVRQTLRRAKRENPGAVTVLTGCMPQAFPEEAANLLEADVVLGNARRRDLLPRVLEYLSSKQRIVDIAPHEKGESFEKMSVSTFHGRTRAFLKIQDGCDRFCSYCIIPYARGRVRSKPLEDLREEVRQLGEAGYQEVVLTGINLPAYGKELGLHLCDAVEAACEASGIRRVRLGSLEPEQLTPSVIQRMAKEEKLCPQFHLSLQSGCDETLRRMNRHYTTAEYREIVGNLRAAFPNCAITTDIMVGFAGETEEEFQASLEFAREIAFAKVHVFAYSRRPGTQAYDMPDQVSNRVKEERSHRMIQVTRQTQQAFLQAQVGRTEEVLFEQQKERGVWEGYTRNYTHVLIPSGRDLSGQLVKTVLTEVQGESCVGKAASL